MNRQKKNLPFSDESGYTPGALGADSNPGFIDLPSDCDTLSRVCREITTPQIREPTGMTFFDVAERELMTAQATGARSDIDRLVRKIQGSVLAYAHVMAQRFRIRTIDADDYLQESLTALLIWLEIYRFICPVCESRFRVSQNFKEHCVDNHGEELEPVKTTDVYLTHMMKLAMFNLLKRNYAKKRATYLTLSLDPFLEGFENSLIDIQTPADITVSKRAVETVRELAERERNNKIGFFVNCCLEGKRATEIYHAMGAQGIFKNDDAARVTVNNWRKRGRLDKYRQALAG